MDSRKLSFDEWWKTYDVREARKWDDYESIARDAWEAALGQQAQPAKCVPQFDGARAYCITHGNRYDCPDLTDSQ